MTTKYVDNLVQSEWKNDKTLEDRYYNRILN